MGPVVFAISLGCLICLIGFWLRRERTTAAAAKGVRDRLIETYGLDEAYVSGDDDSFVGLSMAKRELLVGRVETPQRLPFGAIRAVEGLRDGAVMVRTARDGVPPPPADPDALPPHMIRSLGLRITVDAPEPGDHVILFANGGKQGLDPQNLYLRQQAALAEAWYRKVAVAMRDGAA
ncbi:MAG: hypothetical protein ACK4UQ_09495 [Brevundimonas sp.]